MVMDPTPPHFPDPAAPDSPSDATAELLAAYALDALPADQEAMVTATLAQSAIARALFQEYRRVVHLLPYAVPRGTPSPLVRAAVLRAAHAKRPRRRAARLSPWQYGVAAVMLAGLLVWNIGLQFGPGRAPDAAITMRDRAAAVFGTPGLIAYDLTADPAAPGATGRVYVTPDERQMAMAVTGLPALPPDRAYQLWFDLDARTGVSIATFTVDARGVAMVVSPVPPTSRAYVSCRITTEPRGGSASPTGPPALEAQWPTDETYSP